MLKKVYYVRSKYYSCFSSCGVQYYTRHFTNVLDAWNYYKDEKSHDFDYGDAWNSTEPVRSMWRNDVECTGHLGHEWHPRKRIEACEKTWLIFDDDALDDEDPII